jgi:hypothetical protein
MAMVSEGSAAAHQITQQAQDVAEFVTKGSVNYWSGSVNVDDPWRVSFSLNSDVSVGKLRLVSWKNRSTT